MSGQLDKFARRAWLLHAVDSRYARCETCLRVTDDADRPLLVARQTSRSKFECQSCFDGTRDQEVVR